MFADWIPVDVPAPEILTTHVTVPVVVAADIENALATAAIDVSVIGHDAFSVRVCRSSKDTQFPQDVPVS